MKKRFNELSYSSRVNRGIKGVYRYAIYFLIVVLKIVIYPLPRPFALWIGRIFGFLCFITLRRERKRTLKHLRMVSYKLHLSGEAQYRDKDIKRIACRVFINLGMNAVELLQMPRLRPENLDRHFKITGRENLDNALSRGKGVIMLTSHLGNWEYMGAYFALKGYKGSVIARRIYYKPYDMFLRKLRSSAGVLSIDRNSSVRRMIKILKGNGILGILPDQDTNKVSGIFIKFLGFSAYTPTGPVALAKSTEAAIVPSFIVRKNGYHHIYVEEPIRIVDTGNKAETLRINTEQWSGVVEKYVCKYPEQWVWMHRRWRTKE